MSHCDINAVQDRLVTVVTYVRCIAMYMYHLIHDRCIRMGLACMHDLQMEAQHLDLPDMASQLVLQGSSITTRIQSRFQS